MTKLLISLEMLDILSDEVEFELNNDENNKKLSLPEYHTKLVEVDLVKVESGKYKLDYNVEEE